MSRWHLKHEPGAFTRFDIGHEPLQSGTYVLMDPSGQVAWVEPEYISQQVLATQFPLSEFSASQIVLFTFVLLHGLLDSLCFALLAGYLGELLVVRL
jgi:hypothetical protein